MWWGIGLCFFMRGSLLYTFGRLLWGLKPPTRPDELMNRDRLRKLVGKRTLGGAGCLGAFNVVVALIGMFPSPGTS